jgi:hypothetical protein
MGYEPPAKNTLKFENQVGRKDKDYILPLSDSRFDLINKSPSVVSSMTHIPQFSFKKQSDRQAEVFGKT